MHTRRLAICVSWSLILFQALGCSLFRQPDPNEIPKSRFDTDLAGDSKKDPAEDGVLSLEAWSPSNVSKSIKKAIGQGPNRDYARDRFEQGRQAYFEAVNAEEPEKQKKFLLAASYYLTAAARWPDSGLEQDSLFMAAESYFFADHYAWANQQYEILVKKYPNSRYLETINTRRFAIAKFWLASAESDPLGGYSLNLTDQTKPYFDTDGYAFRVFNKIRVDDPIGNLADDATMAAANANFRRRKFVKADEFYTDLRKAFTESEHQFAAHYLGLKAKLESYMGSDYEGTSLDDAEKLITEMRRRFPAETDQPEELEYLEKSFAEIRYRKGERLWKMAEFYYRRAEYGPARYYWTRLEKEFDDTPFAKKAQERAQTVASQPDTQPKRFAWLESYFNTRDRLKPVLTKALKTPEEIQRAKAEKREETVAREDDGSTTR